jgi:WD40 repeat protein
MLSRIVLAGVLLAALLGIGAWSVGYFPASAQNDTTPPTIVDQSQPAAASQAKDTEAKAPGGLLYNALTKPLVALQTPAAPAAPARRVREPIVIPNSRLAVIDKVDVPAQRDGVLSFIGIEVKKGEKVAPEDSPVEINGVQFRRLKEGDRVEANQLVAMVDETLARADYAIKAAKLKSAEADDKAAVRLRDEYKARWDTQVKLKAQVGGATSTEDVRAAQASYEKAYYEAVSKREAIAVAEQEVNQARKTLEMYEIRCKIPGTVKTLYKHGGESVKNLESVLQIQNYDKLRVEGMVGIQYVQDFRKLKEVVIEPTYRDSPSELFYGHRLDINCVAVSKDAKIVSGSEDNMAMVWECGSPEPRRILRHPSAVRAVACTPPTAEANWCLTGMMNGRSWIWDLKDKDSSQPIVELKGQQRGPIKCAAFSPNGKICATGDELGTITLWNAATGEWLYDLTGHRTMVTALHFTPDSHLVSASRDNTVRFWRLNEKSGEELKDDMIRRRSSAVGQLGVSPDGKKVLDEQGNEMRILSLEKGTIDGILVNPSQASTFRTVALFSPVDARVVLTTSVGSDGTLQLWRTEKLHSYELRELISGDIAKVNCAAFAPNGAFVVAGIKDRLYVWTMPTKEEIENQLTAAITNIESIVESSESKVRIMAEFTNPPSRPLHAGDVVTIVAYPSK